MLTKKQFTLLFCLFLFTVTAYQTQPIDALPFNHPFTDQNIAADDYSQFVIALTMGDVISGYFETDVDTMGLDFFICDAANFTVWDGGGSATGYEVNTNMHTLGFEWTVLYDDTWHIVFSNLGSSSSVWVDIGIDINGDNTPFYDTSTYDYTGYGEVLETDEYVYLALNLDQGAVIDGHYSTFFDTDGLDFFICDASNYDDFDNGYTATVYNTETEMYQTAIDTFTVPSTGLWYFVFHNNGQTDTITYSYGIEVDNSNTVVGGGGFTALSVMGLVSGLLILLILCCVCRSKKKDKDQPPTPPTVDHYRAPPTTPTETVREREIVRDRVLVICPYCGAKNEQGVLTCHNCDADL
ncbi:MAG: hypothetical protein RTU63_14060 [Candidatus Thorarchaeota archaeon]